MNVFELIKEKLEEARFPITDLKQGVVINGVQQTDDALLYNRAISIVDEVAQEYNKNKHTDEYIKGYNQGTIDRADEIQKAREYGYNKAIEECLKIITECVWKDADMLAEMIEQLKGGSGKPQ